MISPAITDDFMANIVQGLVLMMYSISTTVGQVLLIEFRGLIISANDMFDLEYNHFLS